MEQAARLTEFEVLLARSNNPLGTSVLLVLAWIAASDGEVGAAERLQLEQIAQASEHGSEIEALLRCAQRRDLGALQLACEIVHDHFSGDKATLFLEMAIGMAIADAALRPVENFILRFIADLIGIDRGKLNAVFMETTGRPIPDPSDPSSAAYWQSQERRGSGRRRVRPGHRSSRVEHPPATRRPCIPTRYWGSSTELRSMRSSGRIDDWRRCIIRTNFRRSAGRRSRQPRPPSNGSRMRISTW